MFNLYPCYSVSNRENFGSNVAAILALAGSAIGLGNIWRFPYMVGEYGGAAFIVVYILASLILSFYSVVGGWSLKYLLKSFSLPLASADASHFNSEFANFISQPYAPLLFHTIFLLLCAFIVIGGIKSGIEKFNKITMPLLFALIVLMAVFSCLLPGSKGGIDYLLKPDFSKLSPQAIASAVGQSFFSLSFGVLSDVKIFGRCIFDFCDHLTSNYLMMFGGLLTVLFAGWVMKRADVWDEFTNSGTLSFNRKAFPIIYFLMKYLAPIGIVIIFVTNFLP